MHQWKLTAASYYVDTRDGYPSHLSLPTVAEHCLVTEQLSETYNEEQTMIRSELQTFGKEMLKTQPLSLAKTLK